MAKTILIAEDEPSLQRLLTKKISDLGYKVEPANDGEETLYALKHKDIDLVLLDIIMPKKNGLQILEVLRRDLKSAVPVIVLSNLERDEDIETCKSYGIQEYIIKSHISMKELSSKISKAFHQAKD